MTPFLKQAIKSLLSKHIDLQEVIIILPSKRAGVFLQNHLIEGIDKVQFAPDIFSIENFIENLSSLKKANQTHQLFCLYRAYQKIIPTEAQDDFATYIQWGSRLLKDFNDIDAYRLSAQKSLANLGEFHQLEGFITADNKTSFRPVFWENLYAIYQDFQAQLLNQQMATLGMLYQDALDSLEIYLENTTKTHYFIGFNALNLSEQNMIQEFLAKNKGEVIWDLDQYFFEDNLHAAGRFIRSYQREWKYYRQHPLQFSNTHFLGDKNIQAIGFSGNIEQANYVQTFLDRYHDKEGTTAVVLGNEALLLPVLAALPATLDSWNVTMGYGIAQLPISNFFMALIELHANEATEGLNRKSVMQLLSFPPIKKQLSYEGIPIQKCIQSLNENFSTQIAKEELVNLVESKCGELVFTTVENNTDVLIERLMKLLEMLELAFFREKEHLSSAVTALLKKVLAQLKVQLTTANFPVDCRAFSRLFKEILSLQSLDFSGDPIQGVQLMGMLETRVLDFDHVLITNVNEGILPVGKNDQSFFPFAMKKKFGLPTFLDNDAIYTYHFYRLLQRAKNIYLLYNSKSEGLNAGEKSRFIRQLAFSGLEQHQFIDRQQTQSIVIPQESKEVLSKTPLMLEQLKDIALEGFSPTSLSAYLYDPIEFYDRYLLKIKDELTLGKTLSNFQRGTLLHDCLEDLYLPYVGQPMKLEHYTKMLKDLPATILLQYQKAYPKMPVPKGENHLILKAYERSVQQLLQHEKVLVENGNKIVITALEMPFKVPLEHPSLKNEVFIRGKIDRVDQFNGETRLIDYKTGNVEKTKLAWSNWDGFQGEYKRQALFQLLLYAWAYDTPADVSLGIISLKTPKAYLLPLLRKDIPKTENTALVDPSFKQEIEHYLVKLVNEIFDEKKSFVSLRKDEVI